MGMSIIKRFLEDHRMFRQHIKDALGHAATLGEKDSPPATSERDREFISRLRRHARMETEILFPAMQRASGEDARKKNVESFIAHGNDEHTSVAKRHAELTASAESPSHATKWKSALTHFADGLHRHMEKEEQHIFPLAQEVLSPALLAELNQKAETIP
jgi:hemerythrin-like domain-containing protein